MKLWYSQSSPFVRKVMIVAHETGLADKIKIVSANTSPVARNADLAKDNPVGKIPAMQLEDGSVMFDSRVICAWLDSQHAGKRLAPRSGPKRFADMTLEAMGDAIMDAAVLARYERALRPAEQRWAEWDAGQMTKVTAALDLLEGQWLPKLRGGFTMGKIAIASALGYLDFRFPDMNWRKGRRKLARWYARMADRPSMKESQPPAA